jgi:hypothetical protein
MDNFFVFSKKLLILTAVVEAIFLACMKFLPPEYVSRATPVLPVFFMAITFLIHKALLRTLGKPHQKFMQMYMIISVVKLLGLLTMVLIYSILNPSEAITFILYFFACYLIFSFFEARHLTKLKS